MTQEQALKEAKKLFGEDAIAIVSTDEFRRPDPSGTIPPPVVRYIIGWENKSVPTYEGIGTSWEEAVELATKAKKARK